MCTVLYTTLKEHAYNDLRERGKVLEGKGIRNFEKTLVKRRRNRRRNVKCRRVASTEHAGMRRTITSKTKIEL